MISSIQNIMAETECKAKVSINKQHKLLKKLKRLHIALSTTEQLQLSKEATRILVVKNGGLANNVNQEDLMPLFQQYGEVQEIIMLPRKQYCFVCFCSACDAEQALSKLNGYLLRQCKDPTQNVVLYLFYAQEAPPSVTPTSETPPGLHILENFVTEDVENSLLELVQINTQTDNKAIMKHRQVQHYGYEFKYGINDVDVNDPLPVAIPEICHSFLNKALDLGLVHHFPDQLTVNQYKPGQGIPPHVDTMEAFEDGIMSLSLGSQVVMDFRHPDGSHLQVLLPRRSLLVMSGDSRYIWSHGITPRKSDIVLAKNGSGVTLLNRDSRTSFTFRKVIKNRHKPNTLSGETNGQTLPKTKCEALELEKKHVHKVYDDIAEHFSGTRYKPWPKVVEFIMAQPPLSLLLDVGCGNGKCLGVSKEIFEIGSDYSSNLAKICRCRGFETCVADVTCLPFRRNSFDILLCIAVIHHMATEERRLKAVSELVRILTTGGRALIYVWAMEQELDKTQSKYINSKRQKKSAVRKTDDQTNHSDGDENVSKTSTEAVQQSNRVESSQPLLCSSHLKNNCDLTHKTGQASEKQGAIDQPETSADSLPVHINRTQFLKQDMLVPWQLKTKSKGPLRNDADKETNIFHRFYHVFKKGELELLCQKVPDCFVSKSYYDQGNWCVVLEKKLA